MRRRSIFSLPAGLSAEERLQRRHMVMRLSLGWLVMMQVMMLAWPAYLRHDGLGGDSLATLDQAIVLMNWASLVLTIPVILYSAWPIWLGAWASLRRGLAGMDVPVALGIVGAFIPSVVVTWTHEGEVYFDSVTMFVAFLLTARYLELCARQSLGEGRLHGRIEDERAALTADADRVAARFVAVQVALALASGAVWAIWIDAGHAIPVMVSLLVMSCPCAMAMAVPTAMATAHSVLGANPAMGADQLDALLAQARRRARQNLYGSLAWHLLMTPLAMAGLVAPLLALVAMLLSSLAVVWNSLRLRRLGAAYDAACAVRGAS